VRLAYQGEPGAYSEAAALIYGGAQVETMPCVSFDEVFEAVVKKRATHGVVPLENSIGGTIHRNYDLLLEHELTITGEVELDVVHCLQALPGTRIADIKVVYSHPQALAQCRRQLAALAPHAEPAAALSTAAAIEAAMREPGALAVGNEHAAALYGAHIYARDIGDERDNQTRFVVLATRDAAPTGDDKTSLAFTTQHDRPGSLVEVLNLLAGRGLNLTRIESRPTRQQLGTYVFFVDVQGHRTDPALAEVLTAAAAITLWLRVLGSYPRWKPA
jgi:prephenate dehydratase